MMINLQKGHSVSSGQVAVWAPSPIWLILLYMTESEEGCGYAWIPS